MTWKDKYHRNKWGYLNNPAWTSDPNAVRFSESVGIQAGPTKNHIPCGHWHKKEVYIPPYPTEDIYIIHGAPIDSGSPEQDQCRRRSVDLQTVIAEYGGFGTGLDNLRCCYGVTVDDTYVYISDVNNGRIMKRLKSDLSYVHHGLINYLRLHCCHTDGNQLWSGGGYGVDELDINTLAIIKSSITVPPESRLGFVADITSDSSYIYAADRTRNRVVALRKTDLSFVRDFGDRQWMTGGPTGIFVDASHIYANTEGTNRVWKFNVSDWSEAARAGHQCPGDSPYLTSPLGIFCYDGLVYICMPSLRKVQIRNMSDLSYVSDFTTFSWYPYHCYVTNSYIYVTEWDHVCAYDRVTHALVMSNNTFDWANGCIGDGTHLYVVDEGDNRVVKLLLTDLSFVAEYSDPTYTNIWWATGCAVDNTYVYVADRSRNLVHRINKATMAYVDSFGSGFLSLPYCLFYIDNKLYVSNYTNEGIVVVDTTTLLEIDSMPEDFPDPNIWLQTLQGVTCDEDYIYITNTLDTSASGGASSLIIINRSDMSFVGRINLAYNRVSHIAVNSKYLYIAFWHATYGLSYVKRYDKNTLIEDLTMPDHLQYVTGVDTWRSDESSGTVDFDEEPQVWTLNRSF